MQARARIVKELRDLRSEVTGLCERLERIEIAVGELEDYELVSEAPGASESEAVVFHPVASSRPAVVAAPVQNSPTVLQCSVSSGERDREIAAQTTGKFFNRCLQGRPRGDSGRASVRLPNNYYVVCRDYQGRLYTDPVKVFSRFSSARLIVSRGGHSSDFGDSVFAGFHSIWEAKLAVETADLVWPSKIDC